MPSITVVRSGRSMRQPRRPWRALTAWKAAKAKPISLHECRHTFVSLGIAAGLNAKALSEYLGHASVTITFDRYGHLFPGSEHEAAGQLDAYLLRSEGDSRGTQSPSGPDSTGDNRNNGEAATPVTERIPHSRAKPADPPWTLRIPVAVLLNPAFAPIWALPTGSPGASG